MLAQDIKTVCARRLRAVARGEKIAVPVLLCLDEFAGLGEPVQIRDLLLQSRQALMPCVISSQFIPEDYALKMACLSAGLIICHRLTGDDAEEVAKSFGTRVDFEQTMQVEGPPAGIGQTAPALGAVVDQRTIEALPLNGRSWTDLAILEPGTPRERHGRSTRRRRDL